MENNSLDIDIEMETAVRLMSKESVGIDDTSLPNQQMTPRCT